MPVDEYPIRRWLEVSAPDWVSIVGRTADGLDVDVRPRRQSGAPTEVFKLFIDTSGPTGGVRERVIGERLPRSCSERHVNFNGTFCLGLDRAAVIDEEGGARLWETLRTYLLSQLFAEKHGRWPPGRGLSHGDAAYLQIKAEEAASTAGLTEIYAAALDHRQGWLAGEMPELIEDATSGDHACNASAQKTGPLNIRLGCERCTAVAALVRLEAERRALEEDFTVWSAIGRVCCETMPRCELRNYLRGQAV